MHTNIIIEKLLYTTKISSKKALAKEMGYSEARSLHAAIATPTECFFGRILQLAIKKDIDLNWLFSHNPNPKATQITSESTAQ